MCIISFGGNVCFLNTNPIPKSRRSVGKTLRDFLLPILQDGWILTGLDPIRCVHIRTRVRRTFKFYGFRSHISENSDDNRRKRTEPMNSLKTERIISRKVQPRHLSSQKLNNDHSTVILSDGVPHSHKRIKPRRPISTAQPLPVISAQPVIEPTDNSPPEVKTLEVNSFSSVPSPPRKIRAEQTECENESSFDDDSDSDLERNGAEVSDIRIASPVDPEVERMEYIDLTFEEAVRMITPKFQPVLPIDTLSIGTHSSSTDLLSMDGVDQELVDVGEGMTSGSDSCSIQSNQGYGWQLRHKNGGTGKRFSLTRPRWMQREEETFEGILPRQGNQSILMLDLP
jgi:hypothetical protein